MRNLLKGRYYSYTCIHIKNSSVDQRAWKAAECKINDAKLKLLQSYYLYTRITVVAGAYKRERETIHYIRLIAINTS